MILLRRLAATAGRRWGDGASVIGVAAAGYLVGDVGGAVLAGAIAAVGRPRLALMAAAILLATAAVATVVETPLGGSPGSVGRFPLDRDFAHEAARLAGVAVLATAAILARRERSAAASHAATVSSSRRSRLFDGWSRRFVPTTVFTATAGAMIAYAGDQTLRAWLPALILVVAAVGFLALREAGRNTS